jgi:hypothetical protein
MRDGMIKALAATSPKSPEPDVMDRDVATISHRAPLSEATKTLQMSGRRNSQFVGVMTLDNLPEYLMVAEAGRSWRRSANGQTPQH